MAQSFEKEKILFIINPNSGTSFKGKLPEIIKELIDNTYFDTEIIYTRYKGEATEIVSKKLKENCRYFVAVGGDGTINEIAKGLINSQAVLGIIPIGSGNGLARHLKIPLIPEKALLLINNLKIEAIDYGLINDLPFFCTCGVGFDALIGEKFDQNKRRGLTSYVKTVLSEYFNYRPETYQIIVDEVDKTVRKAFLITFANSSQYGNNALIAPGADIRDGKLDICVLSPFPFFKALFIGFRLFSGTIDKSPHMFSQKAGKVLIQRSSDAIIHIDGETCKLGKNLIISIIHRGLKVIVP